MKDYKNYDYTDGMLFCYNQTVSQFNLQDTLAMSKKQH